MKTKQFYGEQILLSLSDSLRNRDEKIDIRECYVIIDQIVNELAKANFLLNWKLGFGQLDELFVTRWEGIVITDPANNGNSYFAIPANYATLPRNGGIVECYFDNSFTSNKKKYFDPIMIVSQKDRITYRSNMAGGLQGRLSVAPINGTLVFNQGKVGATYGNVSVALAIKDSTQILETAPYPIPADIEQTVIDRAVKYFRERKMMPIDTVRDNNDVPIK